MLIKDIIKETNEIHRKAAEEKDQATLLKCLETYKNLMNEAPDDVGLLFLAGTAEMQLGFNEAAITYFKRIIDLNPTVPSVWNNMGSAYRAEHDVDQAQYCYERAIQLDGNNPDQWNNLSTLYINEGNPYPGIDAARKAIEINPEHPQSHWNYALCLMEAGQWDQGFLEHEFGLLSGDRPQRFFSSNPSDIPQWDGTEGKTVVVYGEQGLGDEIMFASAIPDLMEKCNVIIECHPRLEGLMKRSFNTIVYPTRKEEYIQWPTDHQIDYKLPIGSLFRWFRRDGQFPKKPYLLPSSTLCGEYREWLAALGPGPYVGIGWSAGAKRTRQDQRSFKVSRLKSIYEKVLEAGGQLISLQYTEGAREKLERFYEDTGIRIHHWDEVVRATDYDETAALVHNLDLCIVPNTTIAHLCGSMGKECWTLTPDKCAWRYQLKGEQMPFYGSVKQFRQLGDWDTGLAKVVDALDGWLKKREAA